MWLRLVSGYVVVLLLGASGNLQADEMSATAGTEVKSVLGSNKKSFFSSVSQENEIEMLPSSVDENNERIEEKKNETLAERLKQPIFVDGDPSKHIFPPDVDPPTRLNPEAPGSFIQMKLARDAGDLQLAEQYADQYVRYQLNLIYEVRELTRLIGEAFVRQGLIEEDDWIGVQQFLTWQEGEARKSTNSAIKATHEEALRHVTADENNEVEVYYFFTLNCKWCREIAPDVERLWRATQRDSRVKMAAMHIGEADKDLLREYVRFTGATLPIFDGTEAAKQLRIGFVPAIVVVSPSNGRAYLRTGSQDFTRLYELVRTVQGLATDMPKQIADLKSITIGEIEALEKNKKGYTEALPVGLHEINKLDYQNKPIKVDRF